MITMITQKGGDKLWQKKAIWVRFIQSQNRQNDLAGNAVNLFGGILAFSLLGLWAETFTAPIGVVIKYGLPAVFALSYVTGILAIKPAALGIVPNRKAGVLFLLALAGPTGVFRLFQCACEEFIYRGAVYGFVKGWKGVAWGAGVSTAFFVAMHPGAGPVAWLTQAAFGLFACWWMQTKKEIWGLIGIHTVWNLIYDFRLAVGL